jgi:molecular chaperone DnaJ
MGDFGGFSSGGINVNDIFQMFGGGFGGGDDFGGFPGFGGRGNSSRGGKKSSNGHQHFTFKFG